MYPKEPIEVEMQVQSNPSTSQSALDEHSQKENFNTSNLTSPRTYVVPTNIYGRSEPAHHQQSIAYTR